MASETIREQLERVLREHATFPPAEREARRLKARLRERERRLKKTRQPVKEKPC